MIIMALDHVRDFFHAQAMTDDPLNMQTTTPALFFTRWITHFCAPTFVFLAGTSGWFQSMRKSKKELSLFLIKRGLWLLMVEIVIINYAVTFNPHWNTIGLQTIWSIGISMIILGGVIWLPFRTILALGLLIVLGHNSLDFYEAHFAPNYQYPVAYSFLHHQGFYHLWADHNLLIMYPFLSWAGLMMLGYCFGKLFTSYEGAERKRILTQLGIGVIALFILLRAINIYGNPDPWHTEKNFVYTLLSFLDTHKYSPSLMYMCMTIGSAILFIALAGHKTSGLTKFVTVYGRVPFFYYILHFFLIHLVATAFFFMRHSPSENVKLPPGFDIRFIVPGEGFNLWVVYDVWMFGCLLYCLFIRFANGLAIIK